MLFIKMGTNCLSYLRQKAKEIEKYEQVVVVMSGAIKLGKEKEGEKRSNEELSSVELQGYASIGQVLMMEHCRRCFTRNVAQILLTMEDMKHCNHLRELLPTNASKGRVSVVNYNDSIDFMELRKDNDTLAADLAVYCGAERLVILGKYDGLYNGNALVERVSLVDEAVYKLCNGSSEDGTGGFKTKLDAAVIMMDAGKEMIVGNIAYSLDSIINGSVKRTLFKREISL